MVRRAFRKASSITLLALAASIVLGTVPASADTTVVVQPGNMGIWAEANFDAQANLPGPGPTARGSDGSFQAGPGSHVATANRAGFGSYRQKIGSPAGDTQQLTTTAFDGALLSSITDLSFSTFVTSGPGDTTRIQLFVDINGNGVYEGHAVDRSLLFEPRYQNGSFGTPNQGTVTNGVWQRWNAITGGWYVRPAAGPPLQTLATFVASNPGARLATTGQFDGPGSIRFLVGSSNANIANFDGNVDAITINGTTYDFEPTTSTVLPPGAPWNIQNDGTGATGTFVDGPSHTPRGIGSFRQTANTGEKQWLQTGQPNGTPLKDIQLSYSTYTPTPPWAPTINLAVDTDGDGANNETLVFEPYQNAAQQTLTANTWQTWDADRGVWWTPAIASGAGSQDNPISLASYLALPGRSGAKLANNAFGFKVVIGSTGTSWPTIATHVDNISINETVWDFEASTFPILLDGQRGPNEPWRLMFVDDQPETVGAPTLHFYGACSPTSVYWFIEAPALNPTEYIGPATLFLDVNKNNEWNGSPPDAAIYIDNGVVTARQAAAGPTNPEIGAFAPKPVVSGVNRIELRVDRAYADTHTFTYDIWTSQPARNTGWGNTTYAQMHNFVASPCAPADTIAPAAPEITAPAEAAQLNASSVTISGTAEPASTVRVYQGATLIGSDGADSTGQWSMTRTLADASYGITAVATDPAGNPSPASAVRSFVVDTIAPDTTITAGPSGPTSSASPSFSFTSSEANSTFACSLDGAAFADCTSPQAYTGLSDGAHTFEVRATDAAGNTDATPASRSFTVDTALPDTTILTGPSGVTNLTSATFAFSADEPATFECKLDAAAFAACTSPQSYVGLADGDHTFAVRSTDTAGNVDPDPATQTWTVDTAPPDTTIVSAPAAFTGSASATFTFTSSEPGSSFVCAIDGGAFLPCSSPHTYNGLSPGSHAFEVRAIDEAGNPDPTAAIHSWTVDLTTPDTTITSGPSGLVASTDATFTFVADESPVTFECSLDGSAYTACSSPKTYTGLADGPHTFGVRAVDQALNTDATPASRSWTSDATAPAAPLIDHPTEGSSLSTTSVNAAGRAEAATTVELFVDGVSAGTTTASGTGSWTIAVTLTEGPHTLRATSTDAATNVSPLSATRTVTIDTTAPGAPTIVTPAEASTSTTSDVLISGTAEPGARVRVSQAGVHLVEVVTDGSGAWSASRSFANGSHQIVAVALDAASNVSPPSGPRAFTVAAATPSAPTILTPAPGQGFAPGTTVSVTGTAVAGSTITLRNAGTGQQLSAPVTTEADGTWTAPIGGLAEGRYLMSAVATVGVNSSAPAYRSFDVDRNVPVITAPAAGSVQPATVTIRGTGKVGSTVEVYEGGTLLDTATVATDGTWHITRSLAAGPHTVAARGGAATGNTSFGQPRTFQVDASVPTIAFTTPDRKIFLPGTATEITGVAADDRGVTQIRLAYYDARGNQVATATATCGSCGPTATGTVSWTSTPTLTTGIYSVQAAAVDGAGNVSAVARITITRL